MRTRLIKIGAMVAGLAAFAVGGATLASAGQKQHEPQTATQTADTDNVQQGDQASPDNSGEQAGSENEPEQGAHGYAVRSA